MSLRPDARFSCRAVSFLTSVLSLLRGLCRHWLACTWYTYSDDADVSLHLSILPSDPGIATAAADTSVSGRCKTPWPYNALYHLSVKLSELAAIRDWCGVWCDADICLRGLLTLGTDLKSTSAATAFHFPPLLSHSDAGSV